MVKKQLIIDNAIELFAQQGIASTSVQQITEKSGISKGAFYLSFKSKDALILEIIDQLLNQIVTELDYVVTNTKDPDRLLYDFYYSFLFSFNQRSSFAKFFMYENIHSINQELFTKIQCYDQYINQQIITMLEKVYGKEIDSVKYDLLYWIKAFLKASSEFFLFLKRSIDLDKLVQSLVEKTNILARHNFSPFVTKELIEDLTYCSDYQKNTESLIQLMLAKTKEMEEPYIKESLLLLIQQMEEKTLEPVIIRGLIENIRRHPEGNWIAYLLLKHFNI